MAKRTQSSDPPTERVSALPAEGKRQKGRKRLERQLAELATVEAKRLEQLTTVRAKAAAVRTELSALTANDAAPSQTSGSEPALAGPTGYCMRERRRVTISDPTARTLSNGRAALVGACSTCGARVMVLAAGPVSTGG